MPEGAYDALVKEFLAQGMGLEDALSTAGEAYPEEELKPQTEEQWQAARDYYYD